MNSKSKALIVMLCAVAVVAATVFGTLAYLTDSEAATNTFTVGKVDITLDETNVDDLTTGTARDQANQYHLLPGQTYVKDPQVHIQPKSEESYVRMIVTVSDVSKLKAAIPEYVAGDVFLLQNLTVDEENNMTWDEENWPFHMTDNAKNGVYEFRYKDIVPKNEGSLAVDLEKLFTKITVPGTVDNAHLANLKDVKIVVTAHAIQAAGFDDADTAWAAFDDQTK